MAFSDWVLGGHNLLAFVLIIYAFLFMFLALVSISHKTTMIICVCIVLVCSAFAGYFLSARAVMHQQPRA